LNIYAQFEKRSVEKVCLQKDFIVEAHKCSKYIIRQSQRKAHMIEMMRKLSFMVETAKMPSEKAKMHY
jgi:hypothetical protein